MTGVENWAASTADEDRLRPANFRCAWFSTAEDAEDAEVKNGLTADPRYSI